MRTAKSITFRAVLLLGAAHLTAIPAQASELEDLHPAEACVLEGVDGEISARAVDQFLASAGLVAETEPVTAAEVDAIGSRCTQAHGQPQRNGRLFGNYSAGFALREETGRRLEALGYELTRLQNELAASELGATDDANAFAKEILQRVEGEGSSDQDNRSKSTQMLRALIFTHAFGYASMMIAGAKLEG